MRNPVYVAKTIYHNTSGERIRSLVEHEVVLKRLEANALEKTEPGVDETSDLIASLTTYGEFIRDVHIAIESLMEQTYRPKKIILWISNSYRDCEIPLVLKKMEKRGLEIRKTKDIRSYKKLIPALREFKGNPIATFDDDIIYPIDALEVLYMAYKNDPSMIYFRRGHRMKMKGDREFVPYLKFDWEIQDSDVNVFNFPTCGAGALFPPNCFDEEVLNEDAFTRLAPLADDVWFKAMALKKGTMSRKVYSHKKPYIDLDILLEENEKRLNAQNVLNNRNDAQIKAVWDEYNLWENMGYNKDKKYIYMYGGGGVNKCLSSLEIRGAA